MRIILLLLILFSSEVNACGRNGCLFNTCYTDDDQRCWRCNFGIGLDVNKSCKNDIGDLGLPGDYSVVGVQYQYKPPSNPFSSGTVSYYIKYAHCTSSFWGMYSSDRCSTTTKSKDFELDTNNIAESIEDCFMPNKKYIQSISDTYLKDRVCLVKMTSSKAKSYGIDLSSYKTLVCVFNTTYSSGKTFENSSQAQILGCQPYPRFMGPPPFLKGVIPYASFSIPTISDYMGFNNETTFQRPVASINKFKGSTLVGAISIPIDITGGKQQNCIDSNSCASITSGEPDKITVSQNNLNLGKYPRPAIEQAVNGELSFFPCYHTYKNPNMDKLYQGVFIFSINENINKKIGVVNGRDILLGMNYMPVLSDKQTPAGCDLCVNAAEQNPNWSDNIYVKLNTNSLPKCNLDSKIKIKIVKLSDESGNERLYQFKDPCNPTADPRDKAPLRVNMYDLEEQRLLNKCPGSQNILSYIYESESAFLDKYLVKVKVVIPILDTSGEAKYITASTLSRSTSCSDYQFGGVTSSIFISPEGLRDRSSCNGNNPNSVYTLCADPTSDMNKTICTGLYQGPKNKTAAYPDKICIMTDSIWDFISGRYQVDYIKNLNKDNKVVPRMACTYLPGCAALGNKTVTNIGNAIWNESSAFNSQIEGQCDEKTYSYRVDINSYGINPALDESNKNIAITALDAFKQFVASEKTKGKIIPYISERDLNGQLKTIYETSKSSKKKLFTCPTKIKPKGTCIGGIYGVDIDLLRQYDGNSSKIPVNDMTGCVQIADYGTQVECLEK